MKYSVKDINKEIKKVKKNKHSNIVIKHCISSSPEIIKDFISNGFSNGNKNLCVCDLYKLATTNNFTIIIDKSCINWIGTRKNMNVHYYDFKKKWTRMFILINIIKWKNSISDDFITNFNENGFYITNNNVDINFWNKYSINSFCESYNVSCTIDIIKKYIILEGYVKEISVCSKLICQLKNSC